MIFEYLALKFKTMKKNLMILSAVVVALLASCSPAAVASGKYSGTFSSTNLPSSSGTATANVTTNGDDKVNITISSSGNPDFSATGVGVVKLSVPGVTEVTMSLSGSVDVSGSVIEVGGIKTFTADITNNTDTTYISFTGTKM